MPVPVPVPEEPEQPAPEVVPMPVPVPVPEEPEQPEPEVVPSPDTDINTTLPAGDGDATTAPNDTAHDDPSETDEVLPGLPPPPPPPPPAPVDATEQAELPPERPRPVEDVDVDPSTLPDAWSCDPEWWSAGDGHCDSCVCGAADPVSYFLGGGRASRPTDGPSMPGL